MDSYLEQLQGSNRLRHARHNQGGTDAPSEGSFGGKVERGGGARASLSHLRWHGQRVGARRAEGKSPGQSDHPEAASTHYPGDKTELFSERPKVAGTRSFPKACLRIKSWQRSGPRSPPWVSCLPNAKLVTGANQSARPSHPRTSHRAAVAQISLGARTAPREANFEIAGGSCRRERPARAGLSRCFGLSHSCTSEGARAYINKAVTRGRGLNSRLPALLFHVVQCLLGVIHGLLFLGDLLFVLRVFFVP